MSTEAAKRVNGISVVTASYNSKPDWLVHSVFSCLSNRQTWDGDIEVVLVDDGSTDELTKYTQDKLGLIDGVKLVRLEENKGLPSALNRGILESSHDWIARQDDDDISLPERFKTQVDFLEQTPECEIVGSHLYFLEAGQRTRTVGHAPIVDEKVLRSSSWSWFFNHGTMLAKRSMLMEVGLYNTELKESWQPEDWELWKRILESGITMYNVQAALYEYRIHDSNKSQVGMKKKLEWMLSQMGISK